MIRFLTLAITLMVLNSLPAQPTKSPYFPTPEGTAWQYRLGEKKLTIRVAAHEKVGAQLCAKLETVLNGSVIAVQQVAETTAGIVRVSHNGEKITPPVLFLKLPVAKEQSWEVDSKIESPLGAVALTGKFSRSQEDVKVPAGEFKKAIRVKGEFTINGKPAAMTSWYAEKVGMVRQMISMDGQDYMLELEKYIEPK